MSTKAIKKGLKEVIYQEAQAQQEPHSRHRETQEGTGNKKGEEKDH